MRVSVRMAALLAAVFCMVVFASGIASAAELVVNGGFETGDFTGWTVVNSGSDVFAVMSGTSSPVSSQTVLPPPAGTYAAMTDQGDPGSAIIYQDIAVPAGGAQFSATIYLNNTATDWVTGLGFDYVTSANQQFRVDIMNPAAAVDDVGAGVLLNVYQTQPGDPLTLGYTTIQADLTPFAGQTVRIRFGEVDNLNFSNVGVDQVSVTTGAAAAVPTMNQWGMIIFMLLAGLTSLLYLKRRSATK